MMVLGKLAGMVLHQLRNPLNIMKTSLYYVISSYSDKMDERMKKHLEMIEKAVDSSDKLIEDILGFARPREPVLENVDINHVARTALADILVPPGTTLETEFSEDLPAIQADPLLLIQMFKNITINAIEAMKGVGTIRIGTRLKEGWIEVSFNDNGPGIGEDMLPRIFEPLFSTKSRGTGLGLSLCRLIVYKHEGEITVRSRKGYGTIFIILLPLAVRASTGGNNDG